MMADPDTLQHIQFGEEILPVKSNGYATMVKDAALAEKTVSIDMEERAIQIAESE